MICFPNAKINIGLQIIAKRPDAFHDISSVFYPIEICDALEFFPSKEESLCTYQMPILEKENNLVWKAYQLLKVKYNIPTLQIHLLKNIPIGAGLGGGSADAAFFLKEANNYFSLQLSEDELLSFALQLGSDCPFYIKNIPSIAKGRGELLQPVMLSLINYKLVVIFPEIHISTAWAFSKIGIHENHFDLYNINSIDISNWKHYVRNDFEEVVFKKYPSIADIKNTLYSKGALYASMSGSGSAVYGIFEKHHHLEEIKNIFSQYKVYVVECKV